LTTEWTMWNLSKIAGAVPGEAGITLRSIPAYGLIQKRQIEITPKEEPGIIGEGTAIIIGSHVDIYALEINDHSCRNIDVANRRFG